MNTFISHTNLFKFKRITSSINYGRLCQLIIDYFFIQNELRIYDHLKLESKCFT